MNVFPTSLASMIDDLRACTHKQLPELFPLMALLHPELQLRTLTDSPPQRRPLKQRRTHCDLEQAWDCILRKLPMPLQVPRHLRTNVLALADVMESYRVPGAVGA